MRYRSRRIPMAFLLLTGVACGGDSVMNPQLPNGSVSARVDGQQWNANLAIQVGHANNILAFGASGDGITIGMAVPTAMGPATHVIGPGSGANANLSEGGNSWAATNAMGSGTIVLTSLSANHATGTFSFTAAAAGAASPANRQVTQGMFDIDF